MTPADPCPDPEATLAQLESDAVQDFIRACISAAEEALDLAGRRTFPREQILPRIALNAMRLHSRDVRRLLYIAYITGKDAARVREP